MSHLPEPFYNAPPTVATRRGLPEPSYETPRPGPQETREVSDNYRGVHRLNRDGQGRVKCVACFLCQAACPANCIRIEGAAAPWPDREKYPTRFDLDELRCIYCGMCEEACPEDAIELTRIYSLVGETREEMIFDKEQLLAIYDLTREQKHPLRW